MSSTLGSSVIASSSVRLYALSMTPDDFDIQYLLMPRLIFRVAIQPRCERDRERIHIDVEHDVTKLDEPPVTERLGIDAVEQFSHGFVLVRICTELALDLVVRLFLVAVQRARKCDQRRPDTPTRL